MVAVHARETGKLSADAFVGFVAWRLGWRVDSEQAWLLPDVMVRVLDRD